MEKLALLTLSLFTIIVIAGCTQQPTGQAIEQRQEQIQSTCEPNWNCTDWSLCSRNGLQNRSCIDINNCKVEESKPNESQICKPPEPKDLVLQLTDIPSGYEITSSGPRIQSDVSESAKFFGWKEGYFVIFKKNTTTESVEIENHMSIYPRDRIYELFENRTKEAEKFSFSNAIYMTRTNSTMLSNPNIGEKSIAYRLTTYSQGQAILITYTIEFIKEDIYEAISGYDYTTLIDLAKKVEAKIN